MVNRYDSFYFSLYLLDGMSVDDTKKFLQGGLQTVVRKNKEPLSIVYNGAWYISTNVVSITKLSNLNYPNIDLIMQVTFCTLQQVKYNFNFTCLISLSFHLILNFTGQDAFEYTLKYMRHNQHFFYRF